MERGQVLRARPLLALLSLSFAFLPARGAEPPAPAAAQAPILVVTAVGSTTLPFTTVSGLVFSWDPIERVTVGYRTAKLGPAGPLGADQIPSAAASAPFRMRFYLAGANLDRPGANLIEVRASAIGGRISSKATISIWRVTDTTPVPPAMASE